MRTGDHVNKYGTPVSEHLCDTCGNPYTVCPAVDAPEIDNVGLFSNCMSEDCDSYDPAHDLDPALDSDNEINLRTVISIKALRLRRARKENS